MLLPCAQVTLVDGGWRHTVAATTSGVYAWGWNKFGQLGIGRAEDPCTPVRVDALSGPDAEMARISCGWKHTLLVSTSGAFYATGRGTNGQLGMPVTTDMCASYDSVASFALMFLHEYPPERDPLGVSESLFQRS